MRVVCIPGSPCLLRPRRAVLRRSLPGALYYIAHGLLCVAMVTGLATHFLLRNHALSGAPDWWEVQAEDGEEAAAFMMAEAAAVTARNGLLAGPLLTAAVLAFFALHVRASPIVYPWTCPVALLAVAAAHLACALAPLPTLLHEARLADAGAWLALPLVGRAWVSAARLCAASLAFTAAAWALMALVWAMTFLSRRWKAEPDYELVNQWMVTEEDDARRRADVGDPVQEEKARAPHARSAAVRRSLRLAAAQKPQAEEVPLRLPDGPRSYHLLKKLVPVPQRTLEAVRVCSDAHLAAGFALIALAAILLALSAASPALVSWREDGGGLFFPPHLHVRLGWVHGTNASSASAFAEHPWSALHLRPFVHAGAAYSAAALALSALSLCPGWTAVWLRLAYVGEGDSGVFALTARLSPALQAAALCAAESATTAMCTALLWRAHRSLRPPLQPAQSAGFGLGGALWLAAVACRALGCALVARRMALGWHARRSKQLRSAPAPSRKRRQSAATWTEPGVAAIV